MERLVLRWKVARRKATAAVAALRAGRCEATRVRRAIGAAVRDLPFPGLLPPGKEERIARQALVLARQVLRLRPGLKAAWILYEEARILYDSARSRSR